MDKKIGRYSFLLIMSIVSLSFGQQELTLRVLEKNNNKPVTHLALGVPYTLEVNAEGNQDLYKTTIPGIENFYNEFCGASHINLMSHVTTVHNYVLRADKIGTFTLGPVQVINNQGVTVRSNALTLHVEEQRQTDVIVEMVFDKTTGVVGQRMWGKIRFCTCIELQLLHFQLPAIDPKIGQCVQGGQPQQSSTTINGKKYDCYEFPIELTLKQPGRYSLPKIGACCKVTTKKQHSMWGFNFPMQGSQEQWFYSESPLIVQIDALPPCSHNVDGIGQFETARISVDHTKASLGEGIVLTLYIEGKEGVHDFKHPELHMPEGLKYYESKSDIEAVQNGGYKKSCEYIVQGTQAGKWDIPSQTIIVFDINTHKYKKLRTNSVTVTINGGFAQQPSTHDTTRDQRIPDFNDQELHGLQEHGSWQYTPERAVPFVWFLLFCLFIFAGALYIFIKKYTKDRGPEYALYKRRRYAFKQIRKRLLIIKKSDNIAQLYDIFTNLFAERCQISVAELSSDRIEQILKNAGFLAEAIDQWNRFFHQLSEYAFFKSKKDQIVSHDVFNRAQMWVNQLEEKL